MAEDLCAFQTGQVGKKHFGLRQGFDGAFLDADVVEPFAPEQGQILIEIDAGRQLNERLARRVVGFRALRRMVADPEKSAEGVLEPGGLGRQNVAPSTRRHILVVEIDIPLNLRAVRRDGAVLLRIRRVSEIVDGERFPDTGIVQVLRRNDIGQLALGIRFEDRHQCADPVLLIAIV